MYDPNGIGVHNGNIFGFPIPEDPSLVILPVPWDTTSSYGDGASWGPEAIRFASVQLDFFSNRFPEPWNAGILMPQESDLISQKNKDLRLEVVDYLEQLENDPTYSSEPLLQKVNEAQTFRTDFYYEKAKALLNQGKTVAILGGDHSCPLGLMQALNEKHEFGILQIDAHADLRVAYEGFVESHASIMHNAMQLDNLQHLVQVGLRDLCPSEHEVIERTSSITPFYNETLQARMFEGDSWANCVNDIIKPLPKKVYVSFDIDGLNPVNCPNTGTPVPGGLSFDQAIYLLQKIADSGRQIIGFDLCEVTPGENDWDANVGARVLWNLCLETLRTNN